MHPPGKLIQTVSPCHRDDPCNRQTHGTEGKPQKGGPEVYLRLCTQIGWEDQVARPENMENNVKPTSSSLRPLSAFVNTVLSFLRRRKDAPYTVPSLHWMQIHVNHTTVE